jgi:hypothetical protein
MANSLPDGEWSATEGAERSSGVNAEERLSSGPQGLRPRKVFPPHGLDFGRRLHFEQRRLDDLMVQPERPTDCKSDGSSR